MSERTLRLGRRPPSNKPALDFARFFTGVVPPHPAAEDYLSSLKNWAMLGNDSIGDCVSVTWANVRRLITATLSTEKYPNLSQVEALYKTQNPGFPAQDDGMDIQTCLDYLRKTGGPDGVQAVAFAKVDHTNPSEVQAAIAIFGYVWVGLNVLNANMDEFDAGQPWDYSNSPVDGGHSVITGGYGKPGSGALGGDYRFITWAQETSFTDAFWSHEVEECWAVLWPEHLGTAAFLAGVDVATLAADFKALTGGTLPIPTPVPPTPTPVPPAPVPTPPAPPVPPKPSPDVVERFLKALEADIRKLLKEFFG